jgi:cell filamentation protein
MQMGLKGRYSADGSDEGEFQPGSNKRVLKNSLGIKRKKEMDVAETAAYNAALLKILDSFEPSQKFTVNDICKIHKIWLGKIYSWAGEYRSVNLSKGGFQFANSQLISKLMHEFEKDVLKKYTPCKYANVDDIAEAIAVVHTEYILIHPFREGNGRLGRLIAVLMGLQANLPILNFEEIKGKKKQEYFRAVRAGIDRNYAPMIKIFQSIIKRSIKLYRV